MIGLPVFLGTGRVPLAALVQIPGSGWRMSAEALRTAVGSSGDGLRANLNRYTEGLMYQIAQSAAGRSAHVADQRCARWLLMTHDRVISDTFPLTQEFLSQMLGVRRATVVDAESALKRAGLIDYGRGEITILDRPGLERASCECYRLIRDEFDRVLPASD